jgi:hypothetical protein
LKLLKLPKFLGIDMYYRFLNLAGWFVSGVSLVGFFSYTAAVFPLSRWMIFWLVILLALALAGMGLADELIAEELGINHKKFIGVLVLAIAILLIGGIIQWVH